MLTHVLNLICGLQKTHFHLFSINLKNKSKNIFVLIILYMHAYLSPKWNI